MAIVASGSVALNEFKQLGFFDLFASTETIFTLDADADVDIYLRFAGEPTLDVWDYRPYSGSNPEVVTFTPSVGVLGVYVAVNGYEAGTFTITQVPTVGPGTLTQGEAAEVQFHFRQVGINFLPQLFTFVYPVTELNRIRGLLVRVRSLYDQTLLNYEIKLGVDQNQTVQDLQTEVVRPDSTTTTTYGDRTITNYRYLSYSQRVSAYHREVEQLAIALGAI